MIAERIKKRRVDLELTQKYVADKLNVSFQTISKYERGVNIPDSDMLLKISNILDCSTDYLVGKVDIPNHVHIEHNDPDVGMVEFNYPYKLTPAEVQEMVDTLKKYHFDIDALVEDMRKKENEEK